MEREALKVLLRDSGVVGAGGAGFPAYAKLNAQADTLIINCAECEPLLQLHKQLLAAELDTILDAAYDIANIMGIPHVIVAVKGHYEDTCRAVEHALADYANITLARLPNIYPAGDEVVLIYEATGRIVPPGQLPLSVGCIVFNVETVYNMALAMANGASVTHKLVTITGEVARPVTLKVPIGTRVRDLLCAAGGVTHEPFALIGGGPMMGTLMEPDAVVTRTTNAVLVLPADHPLVLRKQTRVSQDLKRAKAACCHCHMCTDLCPRALLGHPIDPQALMRSVSHADTGHAAPYLNTAFCSGCGLCEAFACNQGLSPRALIAECKATLRKNGIKSPAPEQVTADPMRAYRGVPTQRLTARLGLSKYDRPAPMQDAPVEAEQVVILLQQHVGKPAVACVAKGDAVRCGQCIAAAPEGLGVALHASIDGTVTRVTARAITIKKTRR